MDIVNESICNIKQCLRLNDSDLQDLMQVSRYDMSRANRYGTYSRLPFAGYFELSNKLGVGVRGILEGTVDYDALKEHYLGNKSYIPKRYQHYKKSRIAPNNNVLTFAENRLSEELIRNLKNELQINDTILGNMDEEIGSMLPLDIFCKLEEFGFGANAFEALGTDYYTKKLRPLKADLPRNIHKYLELVFEQQTQTTEQNMFYSIQKISHREAIIKVKTRKETQDAFSITQFGNASCYEYIKGCYAEVMKIHLDLPSSTPLPISVMAHNDEYFYKVAL